MAGASSRGMPLAGSLDKVSIKCAESFVQTLTIAQIVACRVKDDIALYEVQWNNSWLCAQMLKDIFDGAASLIQGFSLPNENNTIIQNGDTAIEQQQCKQEQQYRRLQHGQQEQEQQPQPQIRLQQEQQQEQQLKQQLHLQQSGVGEDALSFPLKVEDCEGDGSLEGGKRGTLYICDVCSDGFPTRASLQSHKQQHHHNSSIMSSVPFNLSVTTSQQIHPPTMISRGGDFIPHESNIEVGGGCGGTSSSSGSGGLLLPHAIDMFECDVCRMTFADEEYLRRHKVRCKDQSASEFRCSWCGRGFTTKGSLELHVSAVHLKKKDFGCSICGKLFSRKHILKIHLATHYGERNFECETCGKTFVQKSNYNRHVRIHEAKNFGYKCRYCGQAFTQNKHVEKHVLAYHTDVKDETDTSPTKTVAGSAQPPYE